MEASLWPYARGTIVEYKSPLSRELCQRYKLLPSHPILIVSTPRLPNQLYQGFMLSSQIDRYYGYRIHMNTNGVYKADSVVTCTQMQTISGTYLGNILGFVSDQFVDKCIEAYLYEIGYTDKIPEYYANDPDAMQYLNAGSANIPAAPDALLHKDRTRSMLRDVTVATFHRPSGYGRIDPAIHTPFKVELNDATDTKADSEGMIVRDINNLQLLTDEESSILAEDACGINKEISQSEYENFLKSINGFIKEKCNTDVKDARLKVKALYDAWSVANDIAVETLPYSNFINILRVSDYANKVSVDDLGYIIMADTEIIVESEDDDDNTDLETKVTHGGWVRLDMYQTINTKVKEVIENRTYPYIKKTAALEKAARMLTNDDKYAIWMGRMTIAGLTKRNIVGSKYMGRHLINFVNWNIKKTKDELISGILNKSIDLKFLGDAYIPAYRTLTIDEMHDIKMGITTYKSYSQRFDCAGKTYIEELEAAHLI